MIGNASGFAWEFPGSAEAEPAATGLDGGLDETWADAVWSAGTNTAIIASFRNALDTQRPRNDRSKTPSPSATVVATFTIAV
jgi:hypothetical protein